MSEQDALWAQLRQAGLVSGDMPPVRMQAPWYVRFLQGYAGWMAAMCLLGFFGMLFQSLFESRGVSLVIGTLLVGLAVLMVRRSVNTFVDQGGLALSLTGQVLWLVAFQDAWNEAAFWLLWAGVQAVVLVGVIALPVHRFLSATAVCWALTAAVVNTPVFWLMPALFMALAAWLWLSEERWFHRSSLGSPVAWAVSVVLLQLHVMTLVNPVMWARLARQAESFAEPGPFWLMLNEALIALVWLASAGWMMHRAGLDRRSAPGRLALVGMGVVAVISQAAQGLTIAWLMMLLGFSRGHRVLAGIGVMAFWGYLSRYYYLLEASLLFKSAVLVASGLALLAGYAVLHRMDRREEAQDA